MQYNDGQLQIEYLRIPTRAELADPAWRYVRTLVFVNVVNVDAVWSMRAELEAWLAEVTPVVRQALIARLGESAAAEVIFYAQAAVEDALCTSIVKTTQDRHGAEVGGWLGWYLIAQRMRRLVGTKELLKELYVTEDMVATAGAAASTEVARWWMSRVPALHGSTPEVWVSRWVMNAREALVDVMGRSVGWIGEEPSFHVDQQEGEVNQLGRVWLVFLNPEKDQNWSHRCHYALVDPDLKGFLRFEAEWPPHNKVMVKMQKVEVKEANDE